jgi:predicted negative regulator of RcsB-dependent stress response
MSDVSRNQERNTFLDGQIAQLMGDYLTRLERYEEAREEYQEASEGYENISPASPDFETAQNNQKVILEKLQELPKRQKSSEDFRLEKLFAIEEEQPRPVALKSRVNLSQWLQNIVEESWQNIEQLFASGEPSFAYAYVLRQHEDDSTNSETVSDLIETVYTSQDEHRRRQAALRLGEIGTASSEVLSALIKLIESTQDEETRWSAAESLWHLDSNNSVSGIRRVKDLGMLIGVYPVALMVAVLPKIDETRAVLLRVYPMRNHKCLPAQLQLVVLDGAGNIFLETEARELDNYIQLKFSGSPGEQFSVRVALGDAGITEDFIL